MPEHPDCSCPACLAGLEPFTVEHFRVWTRELVLDDRKPWVVRDFQLAFADDLFASTRGEIPAECWLVIPEGNGKTTFVAGLALYYLEHFSMAAIPVAASSRDQAKRVYQQAEVFVVNSPRLHASAPNVFEQAKGKPLRDVPRCRCERANRKRERARRPPRLRAPRRRRQVSAGAA